MFLLTHLHTMPIVHINASPHGNFHAMASSLAPPQRGRVSPVRRRLFDDVNDAADAHRRRAFLERQLAAIERQQTLRWNFDFASEEPLNGRYQWQRGVKRPAREDAEEQEEASLASLGAKLPRADVTILMVDNNNVNNSRFHGQTKITDFMKKQKGNETSGSGKRREEDGLHL